MSAWRTVGIIAAGNFRDPRNARIIYFASAGLLVMAALMIVGSVIWWRKARTEHPALGPLEVMGTRRWWKSDFTTRTMQLEGARPLLDGAVEEPPVAEPVDFEAMMPDGPVDFRDLFEPTAHEPAVAEAEAGDEAGDGDGDAGPEDAGPEDDTASADLPVADLPVADDGHEPLLRSDQLD